MKLKEILEKRLQGCNVLERTDRLSETCVIVFGKTEIEVSIISKTCLTDEEIKNNKRLVFCKYQFGKNKPRVFLLIDTFINKVRQTINGKGEIKR